MTSVFQYLKHLSIDQLNYLYRDPCACQVVFQCLPSMSKLIAVRMLCLNRSLSKHVIQGWMQDHAGDLVDDALQTLEDFGVLARDGAKDLYGLNLTYQTQLKIALSSATGFPWEHGRAALKDDKKKITPEELELYARERWDAVLHFMVGSDAMAEPPKTVIDILEHTKLMQYTKGKQAMHITNKGYGFMLKGVHEQIWIFMLEYIKAIHKLGHMRQEDILIFLFQLSCCRPNDYYAIDDLSPTHQKLIGDFIDFGLLYRRKTTSKRFYTTSLVVNLIFGGSVKLDPTKDVNTLSESQGGQHQESGVEESSVGSGSSLHLIVETNFKVYAYTTSTLRVAMLSVFVDIVVRMPNLAVGFITRESLRSALINGISAQQIYDFMAAHAHPMMKKNVPLIPENISDQLYLWEHERNRMQFIEGVLYEGFSSEQEFLDVMQFAKTIDAFVWSDNTHYKLAISQKGEDEVKMFLRNRIKH